MPNVPAYHPPTSLLVLHPSDQCRFCFIFGADPTATMVNGDGALSFAAKISLTAQSDQCSRFRNDGLALAPLANSLGHLFSLPNPSGGVLVLGGGLPHSGYGPCADLEDERAWGTEAIVLGGGLPYSGYDPCADLDDGRA